MQSNQGQPRREGQKTLEILQLDAYAEPGEAAVAFKGGKRSSISGIDYHSTFS